MLVDQSCQERKEWGVILFATLSFGTALFFRNVVNVWAVTTLLSFVVAVVAKVQVPWVFGQVLQSNNVFFGCLVGVLMAAFTWVIYPVAISWVPILPQRVQMLYANIQEPPGPILSIPFLLLIVFVEELVWRKIAIKRLRKRFPVFATVIVASVLYALPQLVSGSMVLLLLAFSCGIVWSLLSVLTKGVTASYFAHLVWNILVMIAFPLE